MNFDERQTLLVWAARVLEAAVKDKTYQQDTLLGPHVREFFAEFDGVLSERTIDSYEETLAWLCVDFPDRQLSEITTADLRTFLAQRAAMSRRGKWAATSRRQRTAALKTFFKWAEEDAKLIEDTPARRLRSPKVTEDGGRQAHSPEVIDQLIAAQEKPRDAICCMFFGDLGLRRNELRLLQLKDIDMSSGHVLVRFGKGGRSARIKMTTRLYEALEWYFREEHGKDDYLLYPWNDASKPMAYSSTHYWWHQCLKRAGLEKILLHEMRHSAGTKMALRFGPKHAQTLLRHKNLATTSGYLHLADADFDQAMRDLA